MCVYGTLLLFHAVLLMVMTGALGEQHFGDTDDDDECDDDYDELIDVTKPGKAGNIGVFLLITYLIIY